jgi:hypothetical protein
MIAAMTGRPHSFLYHFLFLLLFGFAQCAFADVTTLNSEAKQQIEGDLSTILKTAGLDSTKWTVRFEVSPEANIVQLQCPKGSSAHQIFVRARPTELVSTFYYGLYKMGFLFPHPRQQISPSREKILSVCNKTFRFQPTLVRRGFHLHTQHPSEWVTGFYGTDNTIARETLIWLARNFQNTVQLEVLRDQRASLQNHFKTLMPLAHNLGIKVGLGVSLAMIQQKSEHLLPIWVALTGFQSDEYLTASVDDLFERIPADYLYLELGSSEFTSLGYEKTLKWINHLSDHLQKNHRSLMVKIHVSNNQNDSEHGNYNFLPRAANAEVGILPHSVFFYGLTDKSTPIYGRKDFSDIADLMWHEAKLRPVWYFPETSYFIGLDIDVPLFLTDYLRARSQDLKLITAKGVDGQITFTTGQELGYWLFDWTVALQTARENLGDETIGLQLLGEDIKTWKAIIDFQTEFLKNRQLIQTVSAENLMDELPFSHPIHERILLRHLSERSSDLKQQSQNLEEALKEMPSLDKIKNSELREMIRVTFLRIRHAFFLRRALGLRHDPNGFRNSLAEAAAIRLQASQSMQLIEKKHNRYPESLVFRESENPTSYPYGYAWPARQLFFWQREEDIVGRQIINPFYKNLYSPFRLLF